MMLMMIIMMMMGVVAVMIFNLDIQTVPTTKSGALQNVEFLVEIYLGLCLFYTLQLSGLMVVALLCITPNVNTFKIALIMNTPREKVV